MPENLPQSDMYLPTMRNDVRPYVPREARSALDVGCGPGGFGATLRLLLGPEARLVGVEPVESQAVRARQSGAYNEVLDGYFPDVIAEANRAFDLIVFNDVLEHVLDPWSLLEATRDYLTKEGKVLAAVPNVQFLPHIVRLVRGRWDYADEGLLDRTHVRFFTRATMIEMFEQAGYSVDSCHGANSFLSASKYRHFARAGRIVGSAQYLHFVIVAKRV